MFFFKNRRAGAARHHAHLRAADMHAIAVADRLVGIDLQPDKLPPRVGLTIGQRRAADEVVVLRLQRDGETDTGLERIGLVGELVVGEDQPGLDSEHVERL